MTQTDACPECLRRSRLLAMLGPYIERAALHQSASAVSGGLLHLGDEKLARTAAPEQGTKLLAAVAAIGEDELLEQLDEAGCWAVCRHSRRFPAVLGDLNDAPKALIGRGDPAVLDVCPADRTIAIVGSRRATSYGREVARTLASELANALRLPGHRPPRPEGRPRARRGSGTGHVAAPLRRGPCRPRRRGRLGGAAPLLAGRERPFTGARPVKHRPAAGRLTHGP
jgi:hypothetical protein